MASGGHAGAGFGGIGSGGEGGLGGVPGAGSGGSAACERPSDDCPAILHVSPLGSDAAEGSAEAPLQTIELALALVRDAVQEGEPAPLVYLCATAGPYLETLSLGFEHRATSLLGHFDCDGFGVNDAHALILAGRASGHQIDGATGVTLRALDLESPTADRAGESSVALRVVDSTNIRLEGVQLIAGDGASGAAGTGHSEDSEAHPGAAGHPGVDACVIGGGLVNEGGLPATTTCEGVPTASVGGRGGPGGVSSFPGGPAAAGEPAGGEAGAGEEEEPCTVGGSGAQGTAGTHGAPSQAIGTLGRGGYAPPLGGDGTPGTIGQGGGGGGGAAKPESCETGASGGSGGGGGCPGAGAAGGQGGGGSFALLSVKSQLELVDVRVVLGVGGTGGAGGDGQRGGDPGLRALGGTSGTGTDATAACAGGDGGQGGRGGSGGGGAGGPSIGIAYVGATPLGLADVFAKLPLERALGGLGGILNEDAGRAPSGIVEAAWTP